MNMIKLNKCIQCGKEVSEKETIYLEKESYCKDCYFKRLYGTKKKVLLKNLIKMNYLQDMRLFKAFMEVPLEEFIPKEFIDPRKMYEDIPNLFYYKSPENYRTISAPHMISIMLQGLSLKGDDDLLILGAKSGYIAALARSLAPKGEIIILEANSDIAKITDENLRRLNLHDNITVNVRNPLEGMPELSPWQKILVTGAIKQELIYPLLNQLDKSEGVLYAPIGEDYIQIYTQILRINDDFYGKKQLQVRFTPLMTQIELDELELITDFDEIKEIEIKDDPFRVEETLNKFTENIKIKYAPSIFDNLELNFPSLYSGEDSEQFNPEERDTVISYLESIEQITKKLKKEDNISSCIDFVDDIETQIDLLNKYKKGFDIKVKKIQYLINEIKSCNTIRKQLKTKINSDSELADKEIEILNKQLNNIDTLHELLVNEIERIRDL